MPPKRTIEGFAMPPATPAAAIDTREPGAGPLQLKRTCPPSLLMPVPASITAR